MLRKVLAIGLPIVIILVAIVGMKGLMKRDLKVKKAEKKVTAQPVRIALAQTAPKNYVIRALGNTIAAQQLRLQPEVAGLVDAHHEDMVLGGTVKRGDALIQIEKADYRLALRQAEAQVGQAELRLKEEEGRVEIAKREWSLIGDDSATTAKGKALALREPQLKSAQLNLKAAIANLERSKLALKRTTIIAPINGVIQQESVDIGLRVSPGQPVATLIGTDYWWVQVSLGRDTLQKVLGEQVHVQVYAREASAALPAKILRTLPDVDQSGRMVRLLLQVDDPMRLQNQGQPLFLGDALHIEFHCPTPAESVIIPRQALRNDGQLWTVDVDDTEPTSATSGRLTYTTPEVIFKDKQHVYLKNLAVGSRVITSNLALPTLGTNVKWTTVDSNSTAKKQSQNQETNKQ